MMRPLAISAAASDPAPMPSANKALIAVSTAISPPVLARTMTGVSDSATAPTIQNQETAMLRLQSFASRRNSAMSPAVEAKILCVTNRPGAARAVEGMNRLVRKAASAMAISCSMVEAGERATESPPAMRPSRIAANVAASTNALPATS